MMDWVGFPEKATFLGLVDGWFLAVVLQKPQNNVYLPQSVKGLVSLVAAL